MLVEEAVDENDEESPQPLLPHPVDSATTVEDELDGA